IRSWFRTHTCIDQRRYGGPARRSLVQPAFFPPLTVARTAGWICRLWCSRYLGALVPVVDGVALWPPQAAMPFLSLSSALARTFQASRKRSTSASVVVQPRLTRTPPRTSTGSAPIAARTCEVCTFPAEQAEPDETAIPLRSKAIIVVSAFTPGTANKVVLGRRGAFAPKITAWGVAFLRPFSSRSRSADIRVASANFTAPAAAPQPAIAAPFSVPARCPRSCPPPLISGSAI